MPKRPYGFSYMPHQLVFPQRKVRLYFMRIPRQMERENLKPQAPFRLAGGARQRMEGSQPETVAVAEKWEGSEALSAAWRTMPFWSATKAQRPELPMDWGTAVSLYPVVGVL